MSRRNLWNVILRTMSHRAVILTTHSMEEAEALCARIAIMVKGQIRCMGTKQHLKVKFGSGYELCIKLLIGSKDVDPTARIGEATVFVNSLFPQAEMISENGGLVTYQIPKDEMKMGVAFTGLEKHREILGIEDYSIAQPTLEQVNVFGDLYECSNSSYNCFASTPRRFKMLHMRNICVRDVVLLLLLLLLLSHAHRAHLPTVGVHQDSYC